MIFVILYKYLNCAVDKTNDTGHTTCTDFHHNYRIILLMMLFITLWCKPWKTDTSRERYTCATRVKPSFAKCTSWFLYVSATAQLANV